MLKNYFKIALRNLGKNKIYTFTNVIGLTVGLGCCILIFMYVHQQLSYDDFHPNSDRLYRVALERIYPDRASSYAIIPSGFSEAFEDEIPEVQNATRLLGFPSFSNVVEHQDRAFEENYYFFADSNFFDLFSYDILQGDARSALTRPGAVILTESTAKKYFGNENPLGKSIRVNGNDTEVTAVMQDIPKNSHMKFDFLSSTTNVGFLQNPNYISFSSYTYLELANNSEPGAVESKIPDVVKKYASGQIERQLGLSYEDYVEAGNGYNYYLQPIDDIYLHSNLENEIKANGSITYVYIFVFLSVFILIIAVINFVNLATARSVERAKEVGVRKVLGSLRKQLISQFLTESVFLSILSTILALGVIQIILPYFNAILGDQFDMSILISGWMPFLLITIMLATGIFAGLYPAFYISSQDPVEVMKGQFKSNRKGRWLRNGLVVFQFAVSIIMIAGTLIIFNQMEYIQNKRLGFDKENVVVIKRATAVDQLDALKQELGRLPGVQQVASASTLPGGRYFGIQFQHEGGTDVLTTKGFTADDHFFETMDIEIVNGRPFTENHDDSLSLILNQTAVKALGLENPIGLELRSTRNINNQSVTLNYRVVGVAEDFNFESLHTPITPMAIVSSEGMVGFDNLIPLRVSTTDLQSVLAGIESIWTDFAPEVPFLYTFLDNQMEALYNQEQKTADIIGLFALLAIIIACIGLFGLAAYTAYQRTKEIGVRKVLGATIPQILFLLMKDFAKLIGIAFILAVPLTYLLMQNWLANFAYRVEPGIEIFLISGGIALVVALLTISYQAFNVATINPANSLRNE
ncbi:MAG: ABC transporter permease [Balneolaceae bacterium]|nr:ABC transporter permease [Balneolaceae bacterium]